MEKHMKECAKVFLRDQKKLFDEPVVYELEEAEDILEECFAQYCSNIKEQLEVFKLDNNGGYFFVEAQLG